MKSIFLFLSLLSSVFLLSQKEDYIWYFGGAGAGLDFRDCDPIVLTDMTDDPLGWAWEGAVTVSDNEGNLLFYTNGYNIYNQLHDTMTNGYQAGLSNSLTQNCVVKKPGTTDIYYVFGPDLQATGSYHLNYPNVIGIKYAEIDMSLQNGLGEVTSKFNLLKDSTNCEKLCIVPHQNGVDYWLIGHEYNNDNFFVFEITSSGINPTPSIQSVGPIINTVGGIAGSSNFDAIGELKASPSGDQICFTTFYHGNTCLFDFDPSTGIISNPMPLSLGGLGGYGVSFSPDNSKLFISAVDTANILGTYDQSEILQFDLTSGSNINIQNSLNSIYTCSSCHFASLKIGPNGKIYVARYGGQGNNVGDTYLGVINSPNAYGMAADYVHDGIYLEGTNGSWALNNFIERNTFCNKTNDIAPPQSTTVKLYPNPMKNETKLVFNQLPHHHYTLQIYNSQGQIVKTIFNISSNQTLIQREALPAGIYFFQLLTESQMTYSGKFQIE